VGILFLFPLVSTHWSLAELACLRHLRELKADGNKITNIDGLQRMDGLVKLSLQDNSIRSIDLVQYRWSVVFFHSHVEPYGKLTSTGILDFSGPD
jgi:Leucine-rich repeat (LRR) protein